MKFVENNTKNAWLTGLSFALTFILKRLLVCGFDVELPNHWYDVGIFILLFIVVCVSIKMFLEKQSK